MRVFSFLPPFVIYSTDASAEGSSVASANEYLSKYDIMPELERYLAKEI